MLSSVWQRQFCVVTGTPVLCREGTPVLCCYGASHSHTHACVMLLPCACFVLRVCRQLKVLALSDNDKLSGELPACWLAHSSLQELQLAGLSDLHGPMPDLTGSSTSSSEELCGFGKLKYINMAGIIGDASLGFTGEAVRHGWGAAGVVDKADAEVLLGWRSLAMLWCGSVLHAPWCTTREPPSHSVLQCPGVAVFWMRLGAQPRDLPSHSVLSLLLLPSPPQGPCLRR